MEISTERLLLRPFRMEDVTDAYHWFSDADVMRFTPFPPDNSLAETKRRIERYIAHQNRHGFSKMIAVDQKTMTPIGDAGFMMLDESRIELGYRLKKEYWGLGLATEMAKAWLKEIRSLYTGEFIHAYVDARNVASIRVLEKVGFTPEGVWAVGSHCYRLYHQRIEVG